jgi:transmembrane sensor
MLMPPTHFAADVAEVREIRLADGSKVTLGARTSIDVDFRDDERRVILSEGDAFFSVSKDPARAFVVVVGNKEVRVVGTKFEIRRRDAGVRVSVVQGTVEVMQVPMGTSATLAQAQVREQPQERILIAGQQVTVAAAGPIPDPQSMPRGEPAAWRHGRLVYVDAPLREVVADANRYSRESIAIGDERIANMRVSVTYPSNGVEGMLSALSRGLSIDIERPAPGKIVLKSKGRNE